jgi:glycosyltransferase involved in cell wall biosynthesis
LIHPAHYEGLPTVLLEAMACGTPVIASAVSGALDVVTDGINGLLVPPRNPDQLARTVLQIMDHPEFARKLGSEAVLAIEKKYSWHLVSQNYLNLYNRLVFQGKNG